MAANSKQYIMALQDFTSSLQNLVDTLKDQYKEGDDAATMEEFFGKNSDWFKMTESIMEDVKDTKKTSKKSYQNTQKILQEIKAIRKSKETGMFDRITDKENKRTMMDGVKSVVLIAGAVMAIGLAFKVVGQVDFLSVIALSIALPLIAHAIKEIATIKELTPKSILMMTGALIAGSIALVATSYILGEIAEVKPWQFMTAIGVALVFAIIGFGIEGIMDGLKGTRPKDLLMLPLAMVAIATAITLSSWILTMVSPIPFWDVIMAGIAIGIATIAMVIPFRMVSQLTPMQLLMGGLGIIVMSTAIMVSSWILSVGNYENYPGLGWSIGVGLALLAFVPAILILGTPVTLIMTLIGSISVLMVAGTILATSYILGQGDYSGGPTLAWTGAVALALLAFVPAMILLGNPIMWLFLGFGMASLYMVAETIVGVAAILNEGDFSGGPTKEWAEGVGLSLIYFSRAMAMATPSVWDWLMGVSLEDQIAGLFQVIDAMVAVAEYLNLNTVAFENAPPAEWAEGIGLAMRYFSEALASTEPSVWDWLTGNTIDDKIDSLKKVIDAMVEIAYYLQNNKVAFEDGPPSEWAEGTGLSIKYFSEALANTSDSVWDWFTGQDIEDKIANLRAVVDVMISVAYQLQDHSGAFEGGPSKSWAKMFEKMIDIFAVAGEKSDDIEYGLDAVYYVAEWLPETMKYFNEGFSYDFEISEEWVDGFNGMVKMFSKAGRNSDDIEYGLDAMYYVAEWMPDMMEYFEEAFSKKVYASDMEKYAKGLMKMGDAYAHLAESLGDLNSELNDMQFNAIQTLMSVSSIILALSLSDSANLGKVLSENTEGLVMMFKMIHENSAAAESKKGRGGGFGPVAKQQPQQVKKDPKQQAEVQKQTKLLEQIKKELTDMKSFMQKIANNSDEVVTLMSTKKKTDIGIKT